MEVKINEQTRVVLSNEVLFKKPLGQPNFTRDKVLILDAATRQPLATIQPLPDVTPVDAPAPAPDPASERFGRLTNAQVEWLERADSRRGVDAIGAEFERRFGRSLSEATVAKYVKAES